MSEANKATLETANAAVTRGDHEGFLAFCTDDTHWEFLGDRTLDGKDAVRRWMAEAYRQGPPVLTVARMVAEGEYVVAFGEVTTKGEGGELTRSAYCDVWRLRDGKLAELKAYVVEIATGRS